MNTFEETWSWAIIMDRERSVKTLIALSIFALVVYFAIVFINSFIISPPPKPLRFHILNKDNATHHIAVEIINESGTVIFAEEYKIKPSERIESPVIAKDRGRYLFRVIMDKDIVKERLVSAASGYGPVGITILPKEQYQFFKERISIDQSVI